VVVRVAAARVARRVPQLFPPQQGQQLELSRLGFSPRLQEAWEQQRVLVYRTLSV
jgi:hypothetical protein